MLTRRDALRSAAALAVSAPAARLLAQDEGKPAAANEKADIDRMVTKGLEWLKRNQAADGHWSANGGQYPAAMTGLAGQALLMEGSTLREGKYSDQIVKAVGWFLANAQPNGLLCRPTESQYTYGHGFGLLFLASAYGEEEDVERRKKLEAVIKKAVLFCGKAQSSNGGWYYTSAADGGDTDEGSTTITQLQALRAARNAGIPVPKEIIDKAVKYLHRCTTPRGGIVYRLGDGAAAGGERPALTAAAVACSFSAGNYDDKYAKMWLKYCKQNIGVGRGRMGHDEYQNYYFAQAVYVLGEDRYGKLFPDDPKADWLRWSTFRASMVQHMKGSQGADGSWSATGSWGHVGPVYVTATNLTMLQLDKGLLPIYHR